MIFRKGELFNGPGGLSLGAKMAGFFHPETGEEFGIRHVWSNDYDENACKTFALNICENEDDPSVHQGPVENLNIEELEQIDCFSFGFPCNDYSQVGEQRGLDGRFGPLYTYGVHVLRTHRPRFFVAENVGGLQSANGGRAFIKILQELEKPFLKTTQPNDTLEYVLKPHMYKFEEYGVPQARHRIIIVGIRKDLADQGIEYQVPAPTTPNPADYRTSRDAITNPPIPVDAPNHEFTRHNKKVVKMLEYIPAGENAWYAGIPEELQLNVRGTRLSNIYKRLDPNRPAYTVTGSGGGGTHMYHWEEPRALTNRERARLQTFPDDFVFKGSKEAVRKQVGMAVPPKGAKIVFDAILKTFARIPYDYVEADHNLQLDTLLRRNNNEVQQQILEQDEELVYQ